MALDAIMDFVKQGDLGNFHTSIYHRLIESIVSDCLFEELVDTLKPECSC